MHIQDLLTIAAESLVIGSITLYSHLFIVGLMARSRRVSPGQLELNFAAVEPEQPAAIAPSQIHDAVEVDSPAPVQPLNSVILPFRRPAPKQEPQIDLSGYSIRQLKSIASAVKLPRYNVEPKGNLAARLAAEVESDRLLQAMTAIAA